MYSYSCSQVCLVVVEVISFGFLVFGHFDVNLKSFDTQMLC